MEKTQLFFRRQRPAALVVRCQIQQLRFHQIIARFVARFQDLMLESFAVVQIVAALPRVYGPAGRRGIA